MRPVVSRRRGLRERFVDVLGRGVFAGRSGLFDDGLDRLDRRTIEYSSRMDGADVIPR